jgi:hypothetical protein
LLVNTSHALIIILNHQRSQKLDFSCLILYSTEPISIVLAVLMKLMGLLSNRPSTKECSTLMASLVVPLLNVLPSAAMKKTLFGTNL